MKSFLYLTLFFITTLSLQAQTNAQTQQLDSLFTILEDYNKFMGSVAISIKGQPFYTKAISYQTITDSTKIPASTDTKYAIGSITKTFTAAMMMQLVEQGKINLDTKLADFYPDLPNAQDITIQQMLNHTSGLHNFTNDSIYYTYMEQEKTKEELLAIFKAQEADFAPSKGYEYSNTAYVLLGYMIEDMTKKTYADALQKLVLNKLELTNTYFNRSTDKTQQEADSYIPTGKTWTPASKTNMFIPHAAGAIFSTPSDLTQFIEGLFSGKLVQDSTLTQMLEMGEENYGLGILSAPFGSKTFYGHTGGIDGYLSNLFYSPDDSIAIAITANGVNYALNDILIGIGSILYDLPYELPTFDTSTVVIQIDTATLHQYEGVFASEGFPLEITIKRDGDVLTAQATGQGAFPLEATSTTRFKFDLAGIVLTFDQLDNNNYQQMTLDQQSMHVPFKRKQE